MQGKKTKYYIIVCFGIFFIHFSCSEKVNKNNLSALDSISYYLDKSKIDTLSYKDRGTMAMKAYLLTKEVSDSLKAPYYLKAAFSFYEINDYENYYKFNIKALKEAKKGDDIKIKAHTLYNLGFHYLNNN